MLTFTRFLGGSSGCNGALAIRGSREDYDDWDLPGWSGEEVFECMKKVLTYSHSSAFPMFSTYSSGK
jgi:choline dehydrogenase-like flavoprotein